MFQVTAADLARQFGKYRDLASREPISITYRGRESLVLLSVDGYRRLKSFDDREVCAAHEIPEEWHDVLEKSHAPAWTTDLDHLMDES